MPPIIYNGEVSAGDDGSVAGFQQGVTDVPALRALPDHTDIDIVGVQIPLPGTMYMYDASSVLPDDGINVVKPTNVTGAGRWLKITGGGGGGSTSFVGLTDTPAGVIPGDVAVVSSSVGGALVYLKLNLTAVSDPTVNDDSAAGYAVNSTWINTATGTVWKCVDSSIGFADWSLISAVPLQDHEETFVPTLGQTLFVLSNTPRTVTNVTFIVNNVEYEQGVSFTVSPADHKNVTWLDVPFTLDNTDTVVIKYFS